MPYRLMGRTHAALVRLRDEAGQGTIEYVGLMVLMATVLTAVVTASKNVSLPDTIIKEIKEEVQRVGTPKS